MSLSSGYKQTTHMHEHKWIKVILQTKQLQQLKKYDVKKRARNYFGVINFHISHFIHFPFSVSVWNFYFALLRFVCIFFSLVVVLRFGFDYNDMFVVLAIKFYLNEKWHKLPHILVRVNAIYLALHKNFMWYVDVYFRPSPIHTEKKEVGVH